MTPCTLYVRLCDLIVEPYWTETHYSDDYTNKSCGKDNSITNHATKSAPHTQLHTRAKTPSTEYTIELATNTSTYSLSSSHGLFTLLQPSTCCGSVTNNTDNNNHNKITQDDHYRSNGSNGTIKSQNIEHMLEEEEEEEEQFDVNGLYIILRHGEEVHRSSELTSQDEITASAAASIIIMSTATEKEDETLGNNSLQHTEHHEEWTTSHTNTECRKYDVEKVNSNYVHCDKGKCDVKKAVNEVKNRINEETNIRKRGRRARRMYEWNELFMFATKTLPNANQVPLTQNILESNAPMNTIVPSSFEYINNSNQNNCTNTSCDGNMYQDKYNKHVNFAIPALHTEFVSNNSFYNSQETLPHENEEQYCREIHKQSTNDSHGTWPHELFDEMVIELWLDAANESLCLARGQLDMTLLYEEVNCSIVNSNNEKNNNSNSNICSQSGLYNSHANLQTQVQDKATSIRETHKRRKNSETNISNNFILSNNDDRYNSSTSQQGEVKRISNTKLWESSSLSKLPLGEDDYVIDVVVPLTSNMHVALFVKLRMQCVGLHRFLQSEYHKEMEERNKVKVQELNQASSLLALPTNTTNTGVPSSSSSSSTLPLLPNIYNNNNNIATPSTISQPPFFKGAQCVAIDHTNYNYNGVTNYVYNYINNNTISSSNNNYGNGFVPSAPITTPSPSPLLVSPSPQPPNMQSSTLVYSNNYFCYYPPSATLSSLSSSSPLAVPSNYQLQQEQCSFAVNGAIEQVQLHNTMLAANINNKNNDVVNNNYINNNNVNNTNENNYNNCVRNNIADSTNSTVNAVLLPSHSSPSVLMQQTMP